MKNQNNKYEQILKKGFEDQQYDSQETDVSNGFKHKIKLIELDASTT